MKQAESAHRRACLRVIGGRPHVAYEATYVLAGIPPLALLADERARLYGRRREDAKDEERLATLSKWQEAWDRSKKARWTHRLIPNIRVWIERRHGELNYHLTQLLTGHGFFKHHSRRYDHNQSAQCPVCPSSIENAEHVFYHCPRFSEERERLHSLLHEVMTPENTTRLMLAKVCFFRGAPMSRCKRAETEQSGRFGHCHEPAAASADVIEVPCLYTVYIPTIIALVSARPYVRSVFTVLFEPLQASCKLSNRFVLINPARCWGNNALARNTHLCGKITRTSADSTSNRRYTRADIEPRVCKNSQRHGRSFAPYNSTTARIRTCSDKSHTVWLIKGKFVHEFFTFICPLQASRKLSNPAVLVTPARSSSVPKRRLATRPMIGAKDLLWRSLECWLSVRRRFSTVFVASMSCASDIFSLVVYGQSHALRSDCKNSTRRMVFSPLRSLSSRSCLSASSYSCARVKSSEVSQEVGFLLKASTLLFTLPRRLNFDSSPIPRSFLPTSLQSGPLCKSPEDWPQIKGLQLADLHFAQPGRIDVLLSTQIHVRIMREGLKTEQVEAIKRENQVDEDVINKSVTDALCEEEVTVKNSNIVDKLLNPFKDYFFGHEQLKTEQNASLPNSNLAQKQEVQDPDNGEDSENDEDNENSDHEQENEVINAEMAAAVESALFKRLLKGETLSATHIIEHAIYTKDDAPINARPYRFPAALREELHRQVNEMLETGIIEASESSYRSNIFLVPKPPDKEGNKSTQKIFTNTAIVIKLNDSCVIENEWARREPLYDGFIIPDVDIFSSIRQIKSRHCIALVGAVWNSVTQLLLHLGHRRRERERGEEIQRLEREREAARIRSQQAISPAEPPASTDSEEPPLRKKRQAPETPTAPSRPTLPIYPPIRTSMF
ncbi:unnamed protein product [Trichogramma brassicae]|uniref:Reverse transcriptase zinc-binding domain-containing protein n=1 Tax=Trichogramma brassicae TaxID=86971 RepID=A0A6H5IWS2_9HYME|nr:unnamed protein product [Trichogramma brassicae]